jgi:hypothetical protein
MMSRTVQPKHRCAARIAILLLAILVTACSGEAAALYRILPALADLRKPHTLRRSPQILLHALHCQLLPQRQSRRQPVTATLTPSPTLTATPNTPPELPEVFQSTLLRQGDIPHTYIENTCQYLKDRWDAGNSPPGTVVMPVMFHSITTKKVSFHDQMTVEAFDDLMQALVEAGFEAINMEQLVGFLERNAKIPPRSVLLIVDDRKREEYFVRHFKPYYEKYGWPVVNAWISAVDTPAPLWNENARLALAGWVDHQAHGVVHNIPATDEVDREFLEREMYGSIEAIQRYYGHTPIAYIWPGGGFTSLAVQIGREAGFKVGFTVNPRGPLLYNWIPLADEYNPKRPTFMAEGSMQDPLMVLPRYWSTDAIWHIDRVRQVGDEAAAEAHRNRSLELEYYDIVCKDVTGELLTEYP